MSDLDATLQALFPTTMAPRYGPLAFLTDSGQRVLAAQDGFYLELRRVFTHVVGRLARSPLALPYGRVEPRLSLRLRGLAPLVWQFVGEARAHWPAEHAAWLSMGMSDKAYRYEPVATLAQGVGHIRYETPDLPRDRVLAVDMHSHGGEIPAFFSAQDNADSVDDTKLEIVVGGLRSASPSVACRLSVIAGLRIDLSGWMASVLDNEFVVADGKRVRGAI